MLATLRVIALLSLVGVCHIGLSQTASTSSPSTPALSAPDSTSLEAVEMPLPEYPVAARKSGTNGQVLVMILVSESGAVEATRVLKGDHELSESAEAAAKKWTFKPFLRGGVPVAAVAALHFEFNPSASGSGITVAIEHPGPMPDKVRVSSSVMQSLVVQRVNPEFPPEARKKRVQGRVTLSGTISKEGTLKNVQVISGPPELVEAAADALRQWQFKPYLFMGRPVEVETEFTINFVLGGS